MRFVLAIILVFATFSTFSEELSPAPPPIQCQSAILVDLSTGTSLYEKNADYVIPPASMTKLMTLHLAFDAIDQGLVESEETIVIGDASSFRSSPPHSSLMFIEAGQSVKFKDLLLGLAIPSGNDASIAVAERISGSVDAFVQRMNDEVTSLGLTQTHFVEPSGYSDQNRTTAREFAKFCAYYIEKHPESLIDVHSVESLTYPKDENLPVGGVSAFGPVTQNNHNNLIGRLPGIDGLKTGFIDESGFNIAATIKRNGRRLLVITMGGPSLIRDDGSLIRALDVTALVTYGFTAFANIAPSPPPVPSVRVWKSAERTIPVEIDNIPMITIDRSKVADLQWVFDIDDSLVAPIEKGSVAGTIECMDGAGTELFRLSLFTSKAATSGKWWRRFSDSIRLLLRNARRRSKAYL